MKYRWGPPRADHKCGPSNEDNKKRADCDPMSQSPCCSSLGYCGITNRHCKKEEEDENCDFRTHSKSTKSIILHFELF